MSIASYLHKTSRLMNDHSPALLTALGVTGVAVTSFLTARATFKAADVLNAHAPRIREVPRRNLLTKKERFELIWKLYIPAVVTGVGTCACIITANRIGVQRTAMLTTALALSERAALEYKNKVVEELGADKEAQIRSQAASDRVLSASEHVDGLFHQPGMQLCEDAYSGRYFSCNELLLRSAEADVLRQIAEEGTASIQFFYDLVGLDETSLSREFGWNEGTGFRLVVSPTRTKSGELCLSYDFHTRPVPRPWTVASFPHGDVSMRRL